MFDNFVRWCMCIITSLMGSLSLCILNKALSLGDDLICIRCLFMQLSISMSHFWIVC